MKKYFLAIDIGASSGRHILGSLKDGRIELEEIYRFENGMQNINGNLCWDIECLMENILIGMKKCSEIGKIPESVGVDTWGVDFVLLDENDEIIGQAVGYRDHRTDGADKEVYKIIREDDLYKRTGIQKAIYNTIYQLMALKLKHPDQLEKACALLMMPDYFHYRLCGKKVQEYSEATTSQLLDPIKRDWDYELMDMLGYNREIFQEILMPGTKIGELTEEVREIVGFNCSVVLPPTHDTASALVTVQNCGNDACFISSGTWSLFGTFKSEPDCSIESMKASFSNEGGYGGVITYLKNIMGLWMIQSVRKQLDPDISYEKLCEEASKEKITSILDPQDESFLSPDDMVSEIQNYCRNSGQQVPKTLSELACVIYNSLAVCYRDSLIELENTFGNKFERINIIGGGANADYLNKLTAKVSGLPVYCGCAEATAAGNIITQMFTAGLIPDLEAVGKIVTDSFKVKIYLSN